MHDVLVHGWNYPVASDRIAYGSVSIDISGSSAIAMAAPTSVVYPAPIVYSESELAELARRMGEYVVPTVVVRDTRTSQSARVGSSADTLKTAEAELLLAEAAARWGAAGEDASKLGNVTLQMASLADGYLGMAVGSTIFLDNNASGWGWFVDPTPGDDSEFITPGNQGEMNRIDLLTVVMHELGHLLGRDYDADGVMAETLAAGIRRTGVEHDGVSLADQVFRQGDDHRADAWLGAWLSEQFDSMHGRGKRRR